MRDGVGLVACSGRGFVTVTESDAWTFLQSLVSQEVSSLDDGHGVHSLLLSPQGKLDVDFRLLRVGDDAWLDTDTGFGERLAASLGRFRIRVDATIEDRSGTWGLLAVHGARVDDLRLGVPPEQHSHVDWEGVRAVRADWPGVPGVDLIGPVDALEAARAELVGRGAVECGEDALDTVRIEAGVARQSVDYDDNLIPQEAELELDAVSFSKGCFVGQELVCRIDTRGHVNRYLRRLAIEGDDVPSPGAEIQADDKVVGTITSASRAPARGVVALGFVRREVEPGAMVGVRVGDALVPATVRERPHPAP